MGFSFISGRRCAKTKRTSGKAAGGRVCGWLLLMAVLAGQVEAQNQECATGEADDMLPSCDLSVEPSKTLFLGQSFNVTCTFNSQDCGNCYRVDFVLKRQDDASFHTFGETEILAGLGNAIGSIPYITNSTDGCRYTLKFQVITLSTRDLYVENFHNVQWKPTVILRTNSLNQKTAENFITTQVQVLLSGIPQESIVTTIVQPLDIVTNIIALSNSQQIEGSYRAKAMINWPDAVSLDAGDRTHYRRQYIINGTTGEITRTTKNSIDIILKSEQVDEDLTLITKNQFGVGNTTSFEFPWPESAIRLTQQNDSSWLAEVNFTEPVTGLEIEDSRMQSIVLSNLNIDTNTDADPINSALTFTANLTNGQGYTLRLNLRNIATTQEIQATMQATTQESQLTPDDNKSNSGIRSQALPQLLPIAAIAALIVNRLMSVRTP